MKLRHASFFSGVGGLDLGFDRAGIETVSLSEFDPYASAVLAERFPGVKNLGDITKIDEKEVPDAEIWSGGFPCQDLSVAGRRQGFQEGTRSSLAFTFLDLVERRRPRWVVLENVAGLLSSNGGRDFGRLLREVVGLGYGVAWRTLDARHFGVAQRRRRVFVVAALDDAFGGLGGECAAEVLLECSGVCGHLTPSPEKGEKTPRGSRPGVGTFGAKVAGSLVARYGKGIGSTVDPGQIVHSKTNSDRVRDVDGMAERLDDREGVEDSGQEVIHKVVSAYGEECADGLNARDWKRGVGNQDIGRKGFLAIHTLDIGKDLEGSEVLPERLDGHRYRVIGNGVVAPVAEFIGRRIVEVDAKWKKEVHDEG